MKQILITGAHGYIGNSFQSYMRQFPDSYKVDMVSLRDDAWKMMDFSKYRAIVHAAGIAHIKETKDNASLYYQVNRDLTAEVAEKAKAAGVRQFIFLSSMSVYGVDEGVITQDTPVKPTSHYGKSKLAAEDALQELQSDDFKVAILRPPMVYGVGCKGNYQTLVKLAAVLPVCPDYKNQRSMISIENLCVYLRRLIDQGEGGLFFPQDPNYICTCEMLREIAAEHGKQLRATKLLNFGPAILRRCTQKGKKAFGTLIYKDSNFRKF